MSNYKKQLRIKHKEDSIKTFHINKTLKNDELSRINSNQNNDIEYLIIVDFEANCSDDKRNLVPLEIIEFPCVVYSIKNNIIRRDLDFMTFCKIKTPITQFCTDLTTITQSMTDSGISLEKVLELNQEWLYKNKLEKSLFVTCGDWDLKIALPINCKFLNITYPDYLKKWANIKNIYEETYKRKAAGMKGMLQELNIPLDGTHHRGIDDCSNIAKIAQQIIKDGGIFQITNFI